MLMTSQPAATHEFANSFGGIGLLPTREAREGLDVFIGGPSEWSPQEDIPLLVEARIEEPAQDGGNHIDEVDVSGSDGYWDEQFDGSEGYDNYYPLYDTLTATNTQPDAITFFASAYGYVSTCPVDGEGSTIVAAQVPRALTIKIVSDPRLLDITENAGVHDDLVASCPDCDDYNGRYAYAVAYYTFDQYGNQYFGDFHIDEIVVHSDWLDEDHFDCEFTTEVTGGGDLIGGGFLDFYTWCQVGCTYFDPCRLAYTQTMKLNGGTLGSNSYTRECGGIVDF